MSASANDRLTEYRVDYPGVDVEPALVSVKPECVIGAAGGPIVYRSLTIDALCVADSKASHSGIVSLRLLIYGISNAARMESGTASVDDRRSLNAGSHERIIPDFPIAGYTAISSYMAPEGFSFERADGTRYFATSEFVVGGTDADLPEQLACQSIWVKAEEASEFVLEVSKCTAFLELGNLKVFVAIDLSKNVASEALRTALSAFLANIAATAP